MPVTILKRPMSSSPESDPDKLGAEAVCAKFDRLLDDRAKLLANWRANTLALADAVAAGRFFGLTLELPDDLKETGKPSAPFNSQLYKPFSAPKPVPQKQSGAPSLFEASGEQSIREMVADLLREASPNPLKASPIRRAVERELGRELHYKTIGMTLYRLAQAGRVRREGFDWFWIPESSETNE